MSCCYRIGAVVPLRSAPHGDRLWDRFLAGALARPWIVSSQQDARQDSARPWPSAPSGSSRQPDAEASPKAGSASWSRPADRQHRAPRAPLCRHRIAAAEGDVRELLAVLAGALTIAARGSAMASMLLSDGTGPLHNYRSPLDLGAAVREATRHRVTGALYERLLKKGCSAMKAIVISAYGGPEVLAVADLPDPVHATGEVLVRVRAFGLNHAEAYMRSGAWGEVAQVPGIEGAGTVEADPSGGLAGGTALADIPLQQMIAKAENGRYHAKPVRVFGFDEIVKAHQAMEGGLAAGKMVVAVS
jgi:Zinc-binding dehydrogenase